MKFLLAVLLLCCLCLVGADESDEDVTFSLQSLFLFDHNQNALFRHQVTEEHRRSDDDATAISGRFQLRRPRRGEEWYSNGPVPDWTDRSTVLIFAKLASNAYLPRNSADWQKVPGLGEAEYAEPFGWDFDNHLRGYVFASMQGQVVIAIKGTDVPFYSGSPTADNDVAQDWLMFQCCGEQSPSQVGCGCDAPIPNSMNRTCDVGCMQQCINTRGHHYFNASLDIFNTVKSEYPNADIFITGHSLGGALGSLLGSIVSYPVVAFESPPERGYAWLMGYQWPSEELAALPIFHFGNDADPIFVGGNQCSTCRLGGAPIRTECHLGYKCVWQLHKPFYSVVPWHQIPKVIELINNQYVDLPECIPDDQCYDCNNWVWLE